MGINSIERAICRRDERLPHMRDFHTYIINLIESQTHPRFRALLYFLNIHLVGLMREHIKSGSGKAK